MDKVPNDIGSNDNTGNTINTGHGVSNNIDKIGSIPAPSLGAKKPSGQIAERDQKTAPVSPGSAPVKAAPSNKGGVEKHGQGVLHHVQRRKAEFEKKMAKTPNEPARDPSHAGAIEAALAAVAGLLTGDLDNIQPHTAAELNLWLESTQYLSDEEPQADSPRSQSAKGSVDQPRHLSDAQTPVDSSGQIRKDTNGEARLTSNGAVRPSAKQ